MADILYLEFLSFSYPWLVEANRLGQVCSLPLPEQLPLPVLGKRSSHKCRPKLLLTVVPSQGESELGLYVCFCNRRSQCVRSHPLALVDKAQAPQIYRQRNQDSSNVAASGLGHCRVGIPQVCRHGPVIHKFLNHQVQVLPRPLFHRDLI